MWCSLKRCALRRAKEAQKKVIVTIVRTRYCRKSDDLVFNPSLAKDYV